MRVSSEWEAKLDELRIQLEDSYKTSAALERSLSERDEKLAELELRLQHSETERKDLQAAKEAAEKQVQSLSAELEELKEQHETLSQLQPQNELESDSEEYIDEGCSDGGSSDGAPPLSRAELEEKLLSANARVTELESLVQTLKEEGFFAAQQVYKSQIQRLEQERARWQGLCTIFRQKDERTDDEIRRRAGEEPELRRKVEVLTERNEHLVAERKELEDELDQYEREEAEWAKEKEIWLEEIETLKGKTEELRTMLHVGRDEVPTLGVRTRTQEPEDGVLMREKQLMKDEIDDLMVRHVSLQERYHLLEEEHERLKCLAEAAKDENAKIGRKVAELHTPLVGILVNRKCTQDRLELINRLQSPQAEINKVSQSTPAMCFVCMHSYLQVMSIQSPLEKISYVCQDVTGERTCGLRFENAKVWLHS